MKTISAALKTHMLSGFSTMATCWKLTRLDGQQFFFTDHDVDIVVDGDTYSAESGTTPSALQSAADLRVDNLELKSFLSAITEVELRYGKFDYAIMDVFQVNYKDLSMGKLWLAQGWRLGEVTINDNSFEVEARSKTDELNQEVMQLYSPFCRATLGDARCGIDLNDSAGTYRRMGAVTSIVTQNRKFQVSGIESAITTDVFRHGLFQWQTPASADFWPGLNATYDNEVKKFDPVTAEVTLYENTPFDITVGDEFTMFFGCPKTRDACINIFNGNIANFRGEPDLPGINKLLDAASPAID